MSKKDKKEQSDLVLIAKLTLATATMQPLAELIKQIGKFLNK